MATATLRPSANGDVIQLTPTPAVLNYLNVDEAIPDEDTTYNGFPGSKVGQDKYDLYGLPDPGLAGTINFVKVYIRVKDLIGSGAWVYTKIKTYGTEYTGNQVTITGVADYTTYSTQYNDNPDTTNSWTWAEIDALQAGARLNSDGFSGIRCTQVYVEVDYTEVGTNMQINIGGTLKDVSEMKINISDVLKDVIEVKQNIGGVLKDVFG